MVAVTIVCTIIAGLLKGLLDKSSENRLGSDWWNKSESWKYKWKEGTTDVERFWGSSRWFVFITDGWHLLQFFMYRFLDFPYVYLLWAAGCPRSAIIALFLLPTIRGASFQITHK